MENFLSTFDNNNSKSRYRSTRDHFQLPKFTTNFNKKSTKRNTKHSQPRNSFLPFNSSNFNSIYHGVKISREFHNSSKRASSLYKKKPGKMLKKSKSKLNIFNDTEDYDKRVTSRKKRILNINSNDTKIRTLLSDKHTRNYKSYNNFLDTHNGDFLRNSDLMMRKQSKKNRGESKKKGHQFVIHTSSTENIFDSREDFMINNRSTLYATRRSHGKSSQFRKQSEGLQVKNITAKSWILYNMNHRRVLGKKSEGRKMQISSLNMIAAFLTAVDVVKELNLNTSKIYVKVSNEAAKVGGTTAGLKAGDVLTMYDLFYGMMVQSGNDCALCLAQTLGYMMDNALMINEAYPVDEPIYAKFARYWQSFVARMNKMKLEWKLSNNTHFTHPHGLNSLNSYSTCGDVLKLSLAVLKTKFGKKMVSTRRYNTTIVRDGEPVNVKWRNTNRMLGWDVNCFGLKVGYNRKSLGCMASYFKVLKGEFIVILLKSISIDSVFKDCVKIMKSAGLIAEEEAV